MTMTIWTVEVRQGELRLDSIKEPLSCEAAADAARILNRFLGPNQYAQAIKLEASPKLFSDRDGAA